MRGCRVCARRTLSSKDCAGLILEQALVRLSDAASLHLQAGLELVELEEVDHEKKQHNEVDEEDAAHDLKGLGEGR